jgi:hypothetical protein
MVWKLIDLSKLKEGLNSLVSGIQKMRNEEQKKNVIGINEHSMLQLKDNVSHADFRVLGQYGIPLEVHSISSVLRDIVKLSKSVIDTNVLSFQYYN